MIQNTFKHIFEQPFVSFIHEGGGDVFVVGGAVRDAILGIEPKDIDLVVTGVPAADLAAILKQFGKVDLVGESFGVFKFQTNGEEFDIALPRSDRKIEGATGHKSIESQSDYTMSIDEDLGRRDFTFNAIAVDRDGEIIDLFGGVADLQLGEVKCVSPEAFVDDPLRMLRAVQFAARFGFMIEETTLEFIITHSDKIKEISPERVLSELQKVFDKGGDTFLLAHIMICTGLWSSFFGFDLNARQAANTHNLAEFLFFGSVVSVPGKVSDFFKDTLAIDNDLFRQLKAFDIVNTAGHPTVFHGIFLGLKSSSILLTSDFIPMSNREPFITGRFPRKATELAISGEKFLELGFKGTEVGQAIQTCLDGIFTRKVDNDLDQLLALVAREKELS